MLAVAQDDHRFALQTMHDEPPDGRGGRGPRGRPRAGAGPRGRRRGRPASRAAAIAGGRAAEFAANGRVAARGMTGHCADYSSLAAC